MEKKLKKRTHRVPAPVLAFRFLQRYERTLAPNGELGEDQGKIANNHLKSLSECCVLYPKPTDLIINFQFGSLNDECEFSVIDMAGQQLINKLIEVQEFSITFSYKLPYSGIYIAILKNSNGIIYQQKIVVLHE